MLSAANFFRRKDGSSVISLLRTRFRRRKLQQGSSPTKFRLLVLLLLLLFVILMIKTMILVVPSRNKTLTPELAKSTSHNEIESFEFQVQGRTKETLDRRTHHHQYPSVGTNLGEEAEAAAPPPQTSTSGGPYHNWELFAADYEEMQQKLKIFVYPDISMNNSFAGIFLPHSKPFNSNSKLGNYFSEHAFKVALLQSSLVTPRPELAHLFFMPFSINAMRNDPRLHSEASISDFVAQYTTRISSEFNFWNASGGADHFYVCCHSVGRKAAARHRDLHNNAIQVTCSSSYFQRLFIAHKDVGLPQVWPRHREEELNPPYARNKLLFFAGRTQNSHIRQQLLTLWGNDTSMDIFSVNPPFSYEEGFRQSRYCLHVKGYEVNTARVSDAIHYGCIPVLISNYYDLPFANVLDWSKFSIVISQVDIVFLKKILVSVPNELYESMYQNLRAVRRHFRWHATPIRYDSFYMTAYQLWFRRGLQRIVY